MNYKYLFFKVINLLSFSTIIAVDGVVGIYCLVVTG